MILEKSEAPRIRRIGRIENRLPRPVGARKKAGTTNRPRPDWNEPAAAARLPASRDAGTPTAEQAGSQEHPGQGGGWFGDGSCVRGRCAASICVNEAENIEVLGNDVGHCSGWRHAGQREGDVVGGSGDLVKVPVRCSRSKVISCLVIPGKSLRHARSWRLRR